MVKSAGAKSISLLFDNFFLPSDAEFYVIGQDVIAGAYLGRVNNKPDGKFAVQPITGDTVVMEYVEPLQREKNAQAAQILLGKVVHGFRTLKVGESGSCNVDVRCPIGTKYVSRHPRNASVCPFTSPPPFELVAKANRCSRGDDHRQWAALLLRRHDQQHGQKWSTVLSHRLALRVHGSEFLYSWVQLRVQWLSKRRGRGCSPHHAPDRSRIKACRYVAPFTYL